MLDAFLKGMLIFFALIGIMEFIYILYSVFALRVLRSDFWIVVRPQENESLEAVIRSLKSCVDMLTVSYPPLLSKYLRITESESLSPPLWGATKAALFFFTGKMRLILKNRA